MERCVHKYLYNYIVTNRFISPYQSGFMKGDSTAYQLIFFYTEVCQALDEDKEVKTVVCDISKAFDRVWHRGPIHKLSSVGISGSLLNWFISYLSGRKQTVVVSNSFSPWTNVTAGVPQGSILGPLLFILYINGIVSEVSGNIRLFADDTSLYVIVDTPELSASILNSDFRAISNWSKAWLVTFNPSKTESMIFSRKKDKSQHPPLLVNGTPIATVKSHKHIGFSFSEDAKWNIHISAMVNKAWTRLG